MHRIALDVMGGDGAPAVPVEAALAAVSESGSGLELLLVGAPSAIREVAPGKLPPGVRVVPASQAIRMDESPALAVRRKRDSSIVVGLSLQRQGEADAFVSAGSTGAVMAASLLVLGPLPGVDRPTVGTVFPTSGSPTLVLDAGTNVDCRPDQLHQFAHLGSIYVRDTLGVERPRVGLLNVGEEPEKGEERIQAVHVLLRDDPELHFVGNVEGNRIIEGACDVLVCDGFVGNVLLKFYESVAGFVLRLLRERAGLPTDRPGLQAVFRLLDYTEYGGAPLLGVDGVSIVCHGSSPVRAIRNAIDVAAQAVESGMIVDLAEDLEALAARRAASPPAGRNE